MGTLHQQLLVLITTPLYAIIIGTEIILSNLYHTHSYRRRDTIQNFALSICSGLVDLVMRGVSFALLSFFFGVAFTHMSHSWMYWVGLLLVVDMMHYWLHRLSHTCRLFWAVHVNHHSSAQFNFTVGFRAGVMEPLSSLCVLYSCCAGGFSAGRYPAGLFHYRNMGYPHAHRKSAQTGMARIRARYPLSPPGTPCFQHLVPRPEYGICFYFWDKLFGTFQPELPALQYEPIRYGLKTPMQDDTLSTVIFHEWADIWQDVRQPGINWKQRLGYVFGPPGWSHNGSRHTSKELRAIEAVDNTLIQAGNG